MLDCASLLRRETNYFGGFQMQKIILASKNPGKISELTDLLSDLPIELLSAIELDIPDIEETGKTFIDNALIKARNSAKHSGLPAIADDSGLSIDALDGAPGVLSARYGGENASDLDRINKVLEALKDVPDEKRTAQFHCAIALVKDADDTSPIICEGIWSGTILHKPQGKKGFGYDPIFYVPTHDCSSAELDPNVKNTISHRARALNEFRNKIKI